MAATAGGAVAGARRSECEGGTDAGAGRIEGAVVEIANGEKEKEEKEKEKGKKEKGKEEKKEKKEKKEEGKEKEKKEKEKGKAKEKEGEDKEKEKEKIKAGKGGDTETEAEKEKDKSAFAEWKARYTGAYENRLRAYSHPYKVFKYFASQQRDDVPYMRPIDFVHSLMPYQPGSGNVLEELEHDKVKRKRFYRNCKSALDLFRLADTDGDGLISYQEYLFFLSLLGTPPSHFQIAFQMFDSDRSGVLDLAEFQRMMRTDVMTEIGATHRQGSRERAASSPLGKSSGLLVRLFGKDGKGTCSFEDFSSLLRQLQGAVLLLEFNCHDVDANGTIAAEDFARSMVAYAESAMLDEFARRIAGMAGRFERVSFTEFAQFDDIIAKLDDVQYALRLYSENGAPGHAFTKGDLKRAIAAVTNVVLSDNIINILFEVFDRDRDGTLNDAEFVFVVTRRHERNLRQPRDTGLPRLFHVAKDCLRVI